MVALVLNELIPHFLAISIHFAGGKPPPDRTVIVHKLRVVSLGLYIAMSVLAAQGIIIGLVCLGFNLFNQHRR
jgi:hypothetical protein